MTRLSEKQISEIETLIKRNKEIMERYDCIGGEEAQCIYESAADSVERMTRWLEQYS